MGEPRHAHYRGNGLSGREQEVEKVPMAKLILRAFVVADVPHGCQATVTLPAYALVRIPSQEVKTFAIEFPVSSDLTKCSSETQSFATGLLAFGVRGVPSRAVMPA